MCQNRHSGHYIHRLSRPEGVARKPAGRYPSSHSNPAKSRSRPLVISSPIARPPANSINSIMPPLIVPALPARQRPACHGPPPPCRPQPPASLHPATPSWPTPALARTTPTRLLALCAYSDQARQLNMHSFGTLPYTSLPLPLPLHRRVRTTLTSVSALANYQCERRAGFRPRTLLSPLSNSLAKPSRERIRHMTNVIPKVTLARSAFLRSHCPTETRA